MTPFKKTLENYLDTIVILLKAISISILVGLWSFVSAYLLYTIAFFPPLVPVWDLLAVIIQRIVQLVFWFGWFIALVYYTTTHS
jgi:hypothetical protein